MGLCVVMNRCAAVEGGTEGGEGGKEEGEGVGEEVVDEEELEVVCSCVCWRDCGFGSSCGPYCQYCILFPAKTMLFGTYST